MSAIVIAQLVSASGYAGFQWTVQLVVYPQLGEVPTSSFVTYERNHQRRISYLVGALFAALVVTTALVCVDAPVGTELWTRLASAALLLVILGVTGLLAVPLHRRLERGWDGEAHRRLVRVDAIRVVAATLNVVVAVALATG